MARQSKILEHELAEFVLGERQRGRTSSQIAAAATDELAHRGVDERITVYAVKRHLASLDAHSVPAAHVPQTVEANARVAFDVAGNLGLLEGKLKRWIEQADLAVRPVQGIVYDVVGERMVTAEQLGAERDDEASSERADVVTVYEIDWQARKAASSELRQASETIANLIRSIYDVEQVRVYQESVNEAIAEASPEVANAVLAKLREKQNAVKSLLEGMAP